MRLANVALLINVVVTVAVIAIVFWGVRNTLKSNKKNHLIMNEGKEVEALVINSKPHDNQKVEGRLSLGLLIEFSVGNNKIITSKDIVVSSFYSDEYKSGKKITVKYQKDNPKNVVVVGDVTN